MIDYGELIDRNRQFAVFDWEPVPKPAMSLDIDDCYQIVDIDYRIVADVVEYKVYGYSYVFLPIGRVGAKCLSIQDGKETVEELLRYWGFKKLNHKWKVMR